jgi:D-alanyl-D-alanine carboxypeptidase/D-alanyl-D-alanine-endopeptidase (penicillin-binding protein 4)
MNTSLIPAFRFTLFCLLGAVISAASKAQEPAKSVSAAVERLMSDPAMRYAQLGFHVEEAGTGKVLFSHDGRVGLVPASSQKVVTAATALEVLGEDFRFQTIFAHAGVPKSGVVEGPLVVIGGGDPTLGSDRFHGSRKQAVAAGLASALDKTGIRQFKGGIEGRIGAQERETIPSGWIWEDLGNYYGAGHAALNWHENRFTLWLRPGKKQGDAVVVDRTDPSMERIHFYNELVSGTAVSGDNAYLFIRPGTADMAIRGTIPCCVGQFKISGAVMDPVAFTLRSLQEIGRADGPVRTSTLAGTDGLTVIHTHRSPSLDSIVHEFLDESVNLFGESLVHAISGAGKSVGSYQDGMSRLRRLWQERGVDPEALRMADGSGLSPGNRVTAESLVKVLQDARKREWFPVFERALPVHDGIRMKSGTMSGVRAYAGYIRGADGSVRVFSIMANNFSGSGGVMAQKLRALVALLAR